jgi:hypothetical protein
MDDDYQFSIFGKDCLVSFKTEPDLESIDVVREILNNLTDEIIKEQLDAKTI